MSTRINNHKMCTKGSFIFLNHVHSYMELPAYICRRYIKNATFFMSLVQATRDVEGSKEKLGGNAPMMATRFHLEGCKVLLGGKFSPQLRKQIAPDILGG